MRPARADRGATLIEIMISLAVVLVGMLALFRVLATSIVGSSTASRISQAQTRAMTLAESMRHSPTLALNCLANTTGNNWNNCEPICLGQLPNQSKPDACIYSMQRFAALAAPDPTGASANATTGQLVDRNQQLYIVDPSSKVTIAGANKTVYDVDVVIGWNDDNSANANAGQAGYHTVRIRTGVFP